MRLLPPIAAIAALLSFTGISASAAPTAAVRCDDFLESCGVNTHIWVSGEDATKVGAALQYTGHRNIREGSVAGALTVNAISGARCCKTSSDAQSNIDQLVQLSGSGALLACEGPNETNNWPVTWNGQYQKGTFVTTSTTSIGTINTSAYYVTGYVTQGGAGQISGPLNFKNDAGTALITGESNLGYLRNDRTGWVGCKFTVASGTNPVVTQLGRWVVAGNSGTHAVKVVKVSDGSLVTSGTVDTAGATAGTFQYVPVTSATLTAGTAYYLMSQETSGGDYWCDGYWNYGVIAKLQNSLYTKVTGTSALANCLIFTASVSSGAEYPNVGMQWVLGIPSGAGCTMPDGTVYAQYANLHNYVSTNHGNVVVDNAAWMAANPSSVAPYNSQGLYTEYGNTWGSHYVGYNDTQLATLPRVTTETGWTTQGSSSSISQDAQGKVYLNVYLSQFKRGWSYTFIYMLKDDPSQGYWGFIDTNYVPKTSGTYMHNFTTVLSDTDSTFTPGSVNYSISTTGTCVHDLLMQKGSGTFELAVWNEKQTGSDSVTVDLGGTYTTVNVYDPTVGTSPTQTLSNVSSVPLTLSDHPVILEFSGAGSGSGGGSLTNWTLDVGSIASNLATNGPTLGNGSANSANNEAISAPFSAVTLVNVGDSVKLSGTAVFTLASSGGADQFRIGLFNHNAQSSITGWLGYYGTNSNNGGTGSLHERTNPNTGGYYSGTGTQTLNNPLASGSAAMSSGTYALSMTLTMTATNAVQVNYTISNGGSYSLSDTYTDTANANTTFTYDRAGFFSGATMGASSIVFSNLAVTGGNLPSPWTNQDIGSVGVAGNASYAGGVFTLNGSGADLWGETADTFQYAYQAVSGTTWTITARVATLQSIGGAGKAGVMIRSDLTAGSLFAMTLVEPSVMKFLARTTTNAGSWFIGNPATGSAPYWVRMVRSGNTFTSSVSADGTSWTTLGSTTMTMPTNVYVGLGQNSGVTTSLATSTFDNVTVSNP